MFDQITQAAGKEQYLTYYLIAAHPGCSEQDMQRLKSFTSQKLKVNPEQVQIFTPTPSTYSSVMYYTGLDPFTRQPIFVEKDLRRKKQQKEILTSKAFQPPAEKTPPARHRVRPTHRALSSLVQPPHAALRPNIPNCKHKPFSVSANLATCLIHGDSP